MSGRRGVEGNLCDRVTEKGEDKELKKGGDHGTVCKDEILNVLKTNYVRGGVRRVSGSDETVSRSDDPGPGGGGVRRGAAARDDKVGGGDGDDVDGRLKSRGSVPLTHEKS